ncbi:DUF418 domain-containing protein [Salinimicrobium sp. GXAS 041]|uniref:DUF418 domain-containing protein n=1 Tax=Salinimicrobium sp. GXAS 041 TaxID=3400806 RepID=UPI003C7100CE
MNLKHLRKSERRIETIDVLRGFALAGILYAHMIIWYTGAALPANVYFKYDSTIDNLAMAIFGAFVFGKFFSVFSFLFGLSFHLHFRNRSVKPSFNKIYLWRLLLLFMIGIVHHVIWRGDILAIYAVLGAVLMFFRRLPLRLILTLSLLLILNFPTHLYELLKTETITAAVDFPMEEAATKYYDLVQNGGFLSVVIDNWQSWPNKFSYQLESGRLLMTFGYFLLGLYAGRANLFTSIEKNFSKMLKWKKFTEKATLFLLLIGLIMLVNDIVTIPRIEIIPKFKWLANFLFSIYNACLTVFFITLITILFRKPFFYSILKPLAAMGRMALTNYLLQTVVGLLLFYEFGLNLFDRTSPAVNVLLAIGVLVLQLNFSKWWLTHYKQGPVEWLWKSLTYFRFNPNRKRKEASAVVGNRQETFEEA